MLDEHLKANGHRVLIAHFGDLVKYICEKFFAWDGAKTKKGRTLLQYVGTDVVRTQRPSYWTDFYRKCSATVSSMNGIMF